MTVKEDILKYYADLLIIQYAGKPNFRAFIEAIVNEMVPINEETGDLLTNDIQNGFNLDNAVGVQLDILGKYIGLSRSYVDVTYIQGNYFGFTEYLAGDIPGFIRGFSTYADFDKEGDTLTYNEVTSGSAELSDFDYRTLLKLKAITNNSDTAVKTIDDALFMFFEDDLFFEETGVMKMIYWYQPYLEDIVSFAFSRGVIPKPAGVQLTGAIVNTEGGYFGLPTYESDILDPFTGFTTYLEFDTKEGEMLNYEKLTI